MVGEFSQLIAAAVLKIGFQVAASDFFCNRSQFLDRVGEPTGKPEAETTDQQPCRQSGDDNLAAQVLELPLDFRERQSDANETNLSPFVCGR